MPLRMQKNFLSTNLMPYWHNNKLNPSPCNDIHKIYHSTCQLLIFRFQKNKLKKIKGSICQEAQSSLLIRIYYPRALAIYPKASLHLSVIACQLPAAITSFGNNLEPIPTQNTPDLIHELRFPHQEKRHRLPSI